MEERPIQVIIQDCDITIQSNSKGIIFKRSRRDRRATDNRREITVSDKPRTDKNSVEWIEKYGHVLWIP
jgi:hypothetical protein